MDLLIKNATQTEMLTDFKELKRKRKVNGEHSLSFLLFKTDKNSHSFPLVETESYIELDGVEYVIKQSEEKALGERSFKIVSAYHRFFDDLINVQQYTTISGIKTIYDVVNFALTGTGYTFQLMDTWDQKEYDKFGEDNALSLLNKALSDFEAEIEINGTEFKFYKKIGQATDFQMRYKHNLKVISKRVDTSNLSTYIKGYGKQNEDGTYVTEAEYTSPNSSIWGIRHAPPVKDDRYTQYSNLLERLQQEIQDEPEISFVIDFVELKNAGYPNETINLGDEIYVIWEPLGIDITARVLEYDEDLLNPNKSTVTLSNFRDNATDKFADLEVIRKTVKNIVDDGGKIKYDVLGEAVKIATEALNNSLTELEYPVGMGIVARDPNNPNRLVALRSSGLGVSTDGGQTFPNAITADGVVAERVIAGRLTGMEIYGGSIDVTTNAYIGDNLYIGDDVSIHPSKSIYFSNAANITNDANTDNISISANAITLDDGNVYIGTSTLTPLTLNVYHETTFQDSVTFNGVVNGLSVSSDGSHNHGIADGTQLALNGGGYVTWVAAGSHSHTIS